MSLFGNFSEFLAKLDKIDWVSPDNDLLTSSDRKLVSKKGNWEMSYSVDEMTSLHDKDVPFRAVIRIVFGGQYLKSWGCISNEENAEFLIWFMRKKNALNDALNKEEKATRKTGEDMWNNL